MQFFCIFPALLVFSDGRYVGSILDRNGLRPARYYISSENIIYMASEVGVTDLAPENVVQKVNCNLIHL